MNDPAHIFDPDFEARKSLSRGKTQEMSKLDVGHRKKDRLTGESLAVLGERKVRQQLNLTVVLHRFSIARANLISSSIGLFSVAHAEPQGLGIAHVDKNYP
jgi:hypothetical protein